MPRIGTIESCLTCANSARNADGKKRFDNSAIVSEMSPGNNYLRRLLKTQQLSPPRAAPAAYCLLSWPSRAYSMLISREVCVQALC
jgi:hypothetical protein